MIIGHLPLGYLSTKIVGSMFKKNIAKMNLFIFAGIFGSILPDLDMFYFYIFDHRQHHHHTYWIHIPIYWGIILLFSFLILYISKKSFLPILGIFGMNVFFHFLADSIVGDIWWLSPFIDKPYSFFTVPAIYKPWWLNFIFHWSFLLEIFITFTAIYVFIKSKSMRNMVITTGFTRTQQTTRVR